MQWSESVIKNKDRVIGMEFLRTFLGGEVTKCRLFLSLRPFFEVIARSPVSDSTEVLFPLMYPLSSGINRCILVLYRYILFWGEG